MFILNLCDKAIYDRMNKGPKHKESKTLCFVFYFRLVIGLISESHVTELEFSLSHRFR
jgi:hypothetical protein